MENMGEKELRWLAEIYPTIAAASTEIINMQSILNLPKGTEHFLTDIHGEYEAFTHVLRNGSGSVKKKIKEVFGNTMSQKEMRSLATLIYYPREKMDMIRRTDESMDDWYKITLFRLIEVSKRVASKYTRSKVRKALPKDFAYVIEELITEKAEVLDKEAYYNEIVHTIIRIGRAPEFIVAMSELIQRLVIDHLHIVGDIFDRGPGPHIIMDILMDYHSLDIQWGNHDVLWMGAAAGQTACIANVIRNCVRYGNLDILEDGYGINLLPLASFAVSVYRDDPCTQFAIKTEELGDRERDMQRNIHKAISVIQFKLEGQLIEQYPEFALDDRRLLHKIDYETGMVDLYGKQYKMLDMNFPTIDPADPYRLSEEEEHVMSRLQKAFENCEKLQAHTRLLLARGGLYKVYNNNILYHGCVPLNEDGSFCKVNLFGETYSGRALYEALDAYVRKGFFALDAMERRRGRDIMWYIWCSPNSPLFGKDRMTTFERCFVAEKEAQKENKNPYYTLIEDEAVVDSIIREFGLDPKTAHIVNGHVPVKCSKGESPIKGHGKVLVIDGGFSKAYQKETGIAGYTLIYNSYGMRLVAHDPFESTEAAIEKESDIHSETTIVQQLANRLSVGDTDQGRKLKERIADLEILLEAYRSGRITEKS